MRPGTEEQITGPRKHSLMPSDCPNRRRLDTRDSCHLHSPDLLDSKKSLNRREHTDRLVSGRAQMHAL